MYQVPPEHYIRLHHVRPRFKNDIENVLHFMAGEITALPTLPKEEFSSILRDRIFKYPGNATKTKKTIDNWRTEISALFGFIQKDGDKLRAGARAQELFEHGDLVQTFKMFLYTFQYPGAHVKANRALEMVQAGVRFKPAQRILQVMEEGEKMEGKRVGLSKGEVCHCMFNDLRCATGLETPSETWVRISENRRNNVEYDLKGDVIRYAGDILDYMEIANLLNTYDSKMYYSNSLEGEAILKFTQSSEWFSAYDKMMEDNTATLEQVTACETLWFEYVNRDMADTDFSTDLLAFISADSEEYESLKESSAELFFDKLSSDRKVSTKDIGDMGEGLVHGHECQRVKIGGRGDLIHLIQKIPTQFAVGYDIQSVELDERKRYIEVKTTISKKPLHFNKVHLTPNEWNTASTMKDRYFIYRLAVSKEEQKLFVIQDPVALYKADKLEMVPRDGAEITFRTDEIGSFEELLAWSS